MKNRTGRIRRRLPAALALAGVVVAGTGCDIDELLDVQDPDTVNPGTLDDPSVLNVVVAGAYGDFVSVLNGGESYLTVSALFSDEFHAVDTFPTRTLTDRRDQFPPAEGNTSDGVYTGLQEARRALKDAAARVEEFRGTADPAYSEMKALEGFTYIFLAEGFCGAVPISEVDESGGFVYGEPQTAGDLFSQAVLRFDDALGAGGGHLAAVGKGRALLNNAQYAAAGTAVSGVPTSFLYFLYHSSSGEDNGTYGLQSNGRYAQSDREGTNGLPFRSANDPRTPWVEDPDGGFDPQYRHFLSLKYTAQGSPVVLASGVEARLIEAEAALQANNTSLWLSKLNELRAAVGTIMAAMVPAYAVPNPTLPALTDPGSANARRDLMFSERGFWLYLTGHRMGDLRRLVRHYNVAQSAAFPTGAYHKGGDYGGEVAFPIDFDETNNPNYTLEQCDVSDPG
jgi:hypothetical protein